MASVHVILKKIRQRLMVAVSREEKSDSKSDLPLVDFILILSQVSLYFLKYFSAHCIQSRGIILCMH